MATVIDICNLALSYLGDEANIVSIDPPEGSVQATHCAKFYPMARNELLELHPWRFATVSVQLAEVDNPGDEWDHAYAWPSNAIRLLSIYHPDTPDKLNVETVPFSCEMNSGGDQIIFTNLEAAYAKYIRVVDDTTMFSPLFVQALAWHLAYMLAGPIYKGDSGAKLVLNCAQMANVYLTKAMAFDSRQRHVDKAAAPPWLEGRGTVYNPTPWWMRG